MGSEDTSKMTIGQQAPYVTFPENEPKGKEKMHTPIEPEEHVKSDEDVTAEALGLQALGAAVRDQDDLEKSIGRQADEALVSQANERDKKRLERAEREKSQLELQIRRVNLKVQNEGNMGPATSRRVATELSGYEERVRSLNADIEDIIGRIEERETQLATGGEQQGRNGRLPSESKRDFLIRTGKITPFSKAAGRTPIQNDDSLRSALLHGDDSTSGPDIGGDKDSTEEFKSHRNLVKPGFADSSPDLTDGEVNLTEAPRKRRKLVQKKQSRSLKKDVDPNGELDEYVQDRALHSTSDWKESDEYVSAAKSWATDTDSEVDEDLSASSGTKRKRSRTVKTSKSEYENLRAVDDGNEKLFQKRLAEWVRRRSGARLRALTENSTAEHHETEECYLPHPSIPDKELEGNFRIPGDIYPALFDYQKVGVQWLWELYSQRVGGIIGDEMGLGKTIQAIAFVAGLHYSKLLTQPVIIVAPATVMKQWVKEFHTWWPALRVSILHASGSGMMDVGREARDEEELLSRAPGAGRSASAKMAKAAKKIVDRVVEEGHVLVTTYSGLQMYSNVLIPVQWGYCVLDEGHTIRNPNTSLTIHCKELRTPNRIILSGTPIQNNLTELWSLFDFVFPMRLGNLLDFKNSFEIPIRMGGYANASNLQVQTANKCAEALKDAISPYLLQRHKVDVATDLPKKTERVLFCKLTKPQREAYEAFLNGNDMQSIINGRRQVLAGIDILRKICNHPDLQDHRTLSTKADYKYGSGNKSGKMIVVRELIKVWKEAGHKILLFSQHKIMLDILESFVRKTNGIEYRRMDGGTPISARQTMIDEFNNNPDINLFLLTTKVGGLGINLTSANRVIIFDPDWNPSTDMQARERAWRLGQKREVEIYRLMMAGTIEEKIFHRQIFKQFLSNKILKDPKQRQTFQMQDLHDLFSLGPPGEIESETGKLFKGTETRLDAATSPTTPSMPDLEPVRSGKLPAKPRANKEEKTIRTIDGVASIQDCAADDDKPTAAAADARAADTGHGHASDKRNSDQRIMSALFARSGVTSAFEHDHIINGRGRRVVAADPAMVQREAAKVAAEAAAQLRRAGEEARKVQAGTVTWTGEFGTAGRPRTAVARAGPEAAGLLSNLRRRTNQAATRRAAGAVAAADDKRAPGSSRGASPAAQSAGGKFAVEIRDFLSAHGGRANSDMLADQFDWQCRTTRKRAEFKAMLGEIAGEVKGRGGRREWVLKEEYRKR